MRGDLLKNAQRQDHLDTQIHGLPHVPCSLYTHMWDQSGTGMLATRVNYINTQYDYKYKYKAQRSFKKLTYDHQFLTGLQGYCMFFE